MSQSQAPQNQQQMLEDILRFVDRTTGLSSNHEGAENVAITQSADGRVFRFKTKDLEEVLQRVDVDGKPFIQVNFSSGTKVLFTDTLVGFKPHQTMGLDMSKIPKVVTTPDLLSVFEAIEESVSSDQSHDHEVEVLKKVFHSILQGGELAGFDLRLEKKWLARFVSVKLKASA